jgi:hypothetical protein
MNKTLLFFCFSTAILVFSIIVVCISPIINNIEVDGWKISSWRTLNCKYFADKENADNVQLDQIQKFKKMKTLCNRKKAMHDLEFASLIINLILGFVCANFSLLHYLDIGKDFEKKTGIIGFITGIIGFIITLVYVCYNGYIFNNDIAFAEYNFVNELYYGGINKLYPNGATHKFDGTKYINAYENDNTEYSQWAKFKDLGAKQYNYDSKLYKNYNFDSKTYANCESVPPTISTPVLCEYIYEDNPYVSVENKDLHDRWLTTLILAIFIVISNIGLLIFGFLLFKSSSGSNEGQTVQII